MFDTLILMLDSTIRVATPLIFAALAGLFCERSGVVNIGLEGNLLASAFAGAATASVTGSAWEGVAAGVFWFPLQCHCCMVSPLLLTVVIR